MAETFTIRLNGTDFVKAICPRCRETFVYNRLAPFEKRLTDPFTGFDRGRLCDKCVNVWGPVDGDG
jgi:hypothetical protein